MDILFINSTKELAINQEANGTLLLGTKLLQAGFDTKVLRFGQIGSYHKDYETFIRDITDRVLELGPKCVSLYTLWPYFHVTLRIAREVKARDPGIVTVLGGPHSSTIARQTLEAMPFVDFVCTGEGEDTVVPFFKAVLVDGGEGLDQVPGLYGRKDGRIFSNTVEMPLCDLETLPRWDDRLYLDDYTQPDPDTDLDNYYMPIDAGRGCPYNCSFCCSSYFWRRTYRLKSPERIMEDIRYFHDRFGIHSFWFSHDAFTTNRKLVSKVCDHIIDSGMDIQWKCSARVDCITEELVLKMKRAGLREIEMGIETGSKRMQKLIHKNLDLDRARHMIRFLVKNGILVSLFFMFGFPEETEEDLNDTLEMMLSLVDEGVEKVGMFLCRFTPATEITEKYRDQLVLDPDNKILSRAIFGYEQEIDMIAAEPVMFSQFYNLKTPVREHYQYLLYLIHLYQQYPNSIKYLRKLYGGDNLRFYRDFYENNRHIFDKGTMHILRCLERDPLEFLYNTMKGFDYPFLPQLKELLRFVQDVQKIRNSEEDITIEDIYGFNFLDFKLRRPIGQYRQGRTEMRMKKEHGVTDMRVIRIEG